MIRGRTRRTGELDFFDDTAPATVVGSVTPEGITGAVGPTDGQLMVGEPAAVDDQATDFADLAAVTAAYNALLATLRDRGVLAGA